MKVLAVVTPPPAIYHGCSTQNTFWEENITPVNMTSCGRITIGKHKEINNGEQYIILDISSNNDSQENKEVTSS